MKLVLDEPRTESLRRFLGTSDLVSCELVLTEVPRAARRAAAQEPALAGVDLLSRAADLLQDLALLPLTQELLATAGALSEPALRSLDAIHIAAALELAPIDAFVTYDDRQAAAARLAGLRTTTPGH